MIHRVILLTSGATVQYMASLSESVFWGLLYAQRGGMGHSELEPEAHFLQNRVTCPHFLQNRAEGLEESPGKPLEDSSLRDGVSLFRSSQMQPSARGQLCICLLSIQ